MKVKNLILLIGSIIIVFFAYKWHETGNATYEPIVTLVSGILTAIGYYFTLASEESPSNVTNNNKISIQQKNKNGDNIAGDKIINNK